VRCPPTLLRRGAQLKQIIDGTPVQFSESFEIHGRQMSQHAYKGGLDGVVSKVRDSAYVYVPVTSSNRLAGSVKR
jgi:ATP-dependent DNA ligase